MVPGNKVRNSGRLVDCQIVSCDRAGLGVGALGSSCQDTTRFYQNARESVEGTFDHQCVDATVGGKRARDD